MKPKGIFLLTLCISVFLVLLLVLKNTDKSGSHKEDEGSGNHEDHGLKGPTMINFTILADARPIDLIDMELSFPDSLKVLDGKEVEMVGFMAPLDSLEDMSRCMIVPSYVGCTFCSPPDLTQVVYVTQGDENETDEYPFIEEPSHVRGIFRISKDKDSLQGEGDGFVYSIEQAEVTAYTGDFSERIASHLSADGHKSVETNTTLDPVTATDLVSAVAEIMGIQPLSSIEIEPIESGIFGNLIWEELEAIYPRSSNEMRSKAFSILGFLPEGVEWLELLLEFETGRRFAIPDSKGTKVLVLDYLPINHPYVRLEIVGAISEAIIRQKIFDNQNKKAKSIQWSDDLKKAQMAVREGVRKSVRERYSRLMTIPISVPPPDEFVPTGKWMDGASFFHRWYTLPNFVGPFFMDIVIGPTGSMEGLDSIIERPPSTMIEFLRPSWYRDPKLWKHRLVPQNFADGFMNVDPVLTDVLGVGGLIPWLADPNTSYLARSIAGQWSADRWALWQFDDGNSAVLLETHWQNEEAAIQFSESIPNYPFQWFAQKEEQKESSTVRILRGTSSTVLDYLNPFSE